MENEQIMQFDEDAEKMRIAKHIIDVLCEEGGTEKAGQLCFPNFGTWDWEPLRLIRSGDGDLIENSMATLRFKMADAQSSGKHAEEAQASHGRKQHEVDVFTSWTMRENWKRAHRPLN